MESGDAAGAGVGIVVMLVYLAVIVLMVASYWMIFSKAGKPGWAVLVPIYNIVVMLQIVGKPLWWILLLFIPIVGAVIGIILSVLMAERFGKGVGYGVGLAFLPFVFGPMLAFGDASYSPPAPA